jgi:FlaG/FlaF family flagellin (archaellin)
MTASDDRLPAHGATERLSGDQRGVSHVLGVILVVAIVLTGVVSIVGFGITGISDSTSQVSDTAVERDLTGFAAAVEGATVHSDSAAGTTTVDLSLTEVTESRERVSVDETAGRLSLVLRSNGTARELANTSLGLVEYENPRSDTRIAYQSGLVFSAPDAGATPAVVRANAFTHRTDGDAESLTLHLIRVTGQVLVDRQLRVSPGETENLNRGVLVGADAEGSTPELVLRVESAYSEGWERTLREVFPSNRTAFSHDGTGLEVVYDLPDGGLFLHAYRHDVALGGP